MFKLKSPTPPESISILGEVFKQLNRTQAKKLRKEIRDLSATAPKLDPKLKALGQAILVILSFVGGTTFVQIRNAYPTVTASELDPNDPLDYPFVVSNDQSLVTFYEVSASYVATVSRPLVPNKAIQTSSLSINGSFGPPQPLRPGDKIPMLMTKLRAMGSPLSDHAHVQFSLTYELHLCPFLPWRRERVFEFAMFKGGDGKASWMPLLVTQ